MGAAFVRLLHSSLLIANNKVKGFAMPHMSLKNCILYQCRAVVSVFQGKGVEIITVREFKLSSCPTSTGRKNSLPKGSTVKFPLVKLQHI